MGVVGDTSIGNVDGFKAGGVWSLWTGKSFSQFLLLATSSVCSYPLPFPGCVLLSAVQAPGGHSPKTQNGLLSPPQEEKLSNSQTSLYEMLQEKGRWGGVSLDQSALLPLRFKNIREKTDAHFVDVIKEDR